MDNFAKYFDHTLLKPEATEGDIRKLCEEALRYHVASVCVNSRFVKFAKECLQQLAEAGKSAGPLPKVAAVVGFPLGAMSTSAKAYEAGVAVREGAGEIDMVLPIGEAKAGNWQAVTQDVAKVKEAMITMDVHSALGRFPTPANDTAGKDEADEGPLLKVILETCLLTDEEIRHACEAAIEGGADFLKTSTGFSTGGATTEHVALMKEVAKGRAKIKASGGIRDLATAKAMIEAGADRLGTSATLAILDEYNRG